MQAVYSGGTGRTGLAGVLPVVVALEAAAIDNQCSNVVFVIGLPPTCTTASLGMPLLPHAARASEAKKTAPSADMKRNLLDTTRAL
jgi:hypothetical protein